MIPHLSERALIPTYLQIEGCSVSSFWNAKNILLKNIHSTYFSIKQLLTAKDARQLMQHYFLSAGIYNQHYTVCLPTSHNLLGVQVSKYFILGYQLNLFLMEWNAFGFIPCWITEVCNIILQSNNITILGKIVLCKSLLMLWVLRSL